ncbi:MAG: hypothetical protein ACI8Q9_001197 [Planctomycetota bacterium]|jgi:hypothetical protein
MAPAAILIALVIPKTVHPDGYVETSIWTYFFVGFHVLAVIGCVRGCMRYLYGTAGCTLQGGSPLGVGFPWALDWLRGLYLDGCHRASRLVLTKHFRFRLWPTRPLYPGLRV